MKHPAVLVAAMLSIALIVCAIIASLTLQSFGKSLERSAQYLRPTDVSIPSQITLRTPDRINLHIDPSSGGGGAVRIETIHRNTSP